MAGIKSVARFVFQFLWFVFLFLLTTGIGYGGILYFFGETTVVAVDGAGKTLVAPVTVNGKPIGVTPFRGRLGPGWFRIRVDPPEGYRSDTVTRDLFSAGSGMDFTVTMRQIKYRVFLQAPSGRTLDFIVMDSAGQPIGSCDGEQCEVPLPGPGEYRAKATGEGYDGNTSVFQLSPELESKDISWR